MYINKKKKMKKIFSIKFLLVCVFILGCNAKKDINKEMGYTVVESKIDKRKYKDNGRQYYAVTVGLHGDQNIAEKNARGFAQAEFSDKMETMVQSMGTITSSSALKNTIGKLSIEDQTKLLTKAVATELQTIEEELSYREVNGQIEYKYTGVFKIDLDDIITGWVQSQ